MSTTTMATSTRSTYRVDFHSHTGHSKDSLCPAHRLLEAAARRGLAALAVTDHDTFGGAQQALAVVARDPQRYGGLVILPGEEVKTAEGELIGLLINETIPRGLSPEETIVRIHDQGGLVLVPHPFDRIRHSRLQASALERVVSHVDAFEVFNARTTFAGDNRAAEVFAKRHDLPQVAGSDAHVAWEVGHTYVEFDAPPATTAQALLAQLRQGRIVGKPSSPIVHLGSSLAKYRKRFGLAPMVQL
jgi:predicted metal-dependent phosphoesterase TrpH